MALFGDPLFGEEQFAFNQYEVVATESMTLSDTLTKSVSMTLQDSQNTVDAISDGVSLSAFMDNLRLGPTGIGTLFGTYMFGEAMWQKTEIDGNLLLMPIKVLTDTMTLSDTLQPFSISKELLETLTLSSANTFEIDQVLSDFLFFDEDIKVEITNKALNDSIRLNDWLTVKLKPASEPWGD